MEHSSSRQGLSTVTRFDALDRHVHMKNRCNLVENILKALRKFTLGPKAMPCYSVRVPLITCCLFCVALMSTLAHDSLPHASLCFYRRECIVYSSLLGSILVASWVTSLCHHCPDPLCFSLLNLSCPLYPLYLFDFSISTISLAFSFVHQIGYLASCD